MPDLTAAQAGIPETEQIKLALKLILSQGGIAVMQQIYDVIEESMGENVCLSSQGKNSLRRTINRSAVNRGFILPYDDNNPGWRITDQGVAYITQELGHSIGTIKVTARAYVNFLLASKEVHTLLDFYDQVRQDTNGRNKSLDIFKKTGIILIITLWETFIEDIFYLHINHKLENASSPSQMQKAFDTIATDWYVAIINKQPGRPKSTDFANWTGDNWKQLVRDKLHNDIGTSLRKARRIN